jgi:transcriptional regulator with XRE-family HTH domain
MTRPREKFRQILDRVDHELTASADRYHNVSRLTEADVIDIANRVANTRESFRSIGDRYDICERYVLHIARGLCFPHIERPITWYRKWRITKEIVEEVIRLDKEGKLLRKEIADVVGVSSSTITKIIAGEYFPEVSREGIRPWYREIKAKVTPELARKVYDDVMNGMTQTAAAKKHNISPYYASRIMHGKVVKELDCGIIDRRQFNNSNNKRTKSLLSDRKKVYAAKAKGMVYNEYGMLVEVK